MSGSVRARPVTIPPIADPTSSTLFPSTARLIRFAIPLMLAGVAPPLMGIVNVAVLGRLGDPAVIAGVGVANTIFTVIIWSFAFLRYTTTGLVAQASGRGKRDEVVVQGLRPLAAAMLGGAGLLLLQVPILSLGLSLIAPEVEVAELARQFFYVRILGSPFSLALYALLAWFMGVGSARVVLLSQLFLNGLNALLAIWFVLGLGWGVSGAGWASVVAEAATTVLVVALMFAREPLSVWRAQLACVFDWSAWRPLLSANADLVIRTLLLALSIAFLNERGARLGTLTLAANQILIQAYFLMATLADGVALAAEVHVGRAVGAANPAALRHVVRRCARMALIWGAVIAVLVYFSRDLYLPLMTVSPELVAEAARYWPWQGILPLLAVWAFMWDGIYFGATRTRTLRNSMVLSAAIFAVCAVGLGAWLGNHGLWLALGILLVVRVTTLTLAWPALVAATAPAGPDVTDSTLIKT